jgi:hypothetical protein
MSTYNTRWPSTLRAQAAPGWASVAVYVCLTDPPSGMSGAMDSFDTGTLQNSAGIVA